MKVGGNESAKQFMSTQGNAAAFYSKDPKVKYTSPGAIAYKTELKRRAAKDEQQYPDQVVADDIGTPSVQDKRKSEDFFESWDKPNVNKPTPPPSRTATPPVIGRTPSPAVNGKPGSATPRSNLSLDPSAPRTTTSSAIRASRTTTSAGARKTGVLGAKKPQKLAAKKITEPISFEEAEKAAKEEAERIEKWGADEVELKKPDPIKSTPISASAPSTKPATPVKATDSSADISRLGMGMQRLGFGMTANAPKPAVRTQSAPRNPFPHLADIS
jgi:ADP-ribosylation factor GTPase-activating protein 2/3